MAISAQLTNLMPRTGQPRSLLWTGNHSRQVRKRHSTSWWIVGNREFERIRNDKSAWRRPTSGWCVIRALLRWRRPSGSRTGRRGRESTSVRRPPSGFVRPFKKDIQKGCSLATAADEDKRKLRIAGKRCVRHQRSRPAPIAFGHPGMPFEYRAGELN